MWNGAPGFDHCVRLAQRIDKRLHGQECAVGCRVHVGEVEHGADPVESRRDLDDVVDRPEFAHAAHHLDPKRHRAVLALESLAQLAELLDDRVDRFLTRSLEQEPGWKTTTSAPAAFAIPAEWSSIPTAMFSFLPRSAWPMKPAIGA